jgi:hypothetical protein
MPYENLYLADDLDHWLTVYTIEPMGDKAATRAAMLPVGPGQDGG